MGGLCSKEGVDETPVTTTGRRARYEAETHSHRRGGVARKRSSADEVREDDDADRTTDAVASGGNGTSRSRRVAEPALLPSEMFEPSFRQFDAGPFPRGTQALCVAAAGAGRFLVGGENGALHCIETSSGASVHTWPDAHRGDVNRVTGPHAVSGLAFTASRDKTLKAWRVPSAAAADGAEGDGAASELVADADRPPGAPVAVFCGHTLNVTAVAADPTGARVVSGSRDNSVRLWDVETAACLATQDIKLNIVHFCKWVPALGLVAQGGEDLTVRLWDPRAKGGTQLQLLDTMANFDYHPICAALVGAAESSTRLFTGHNGFNCQGAMITEWDLRMRAPVRHLRGHRGTVRWLCEVPAAAAAAAGPPKLLSASDDGTVRIWSAEDGRFDAEVRFPEGNVVCCEGLGDGSVVLACRTGVVVQAAPSPFGDALLRRRYFGVPGEP